MLKPSRHITCLLLTIAVYCLDTIHVYAKDSAQRHLPLPSSLPLVDYERKLYRWILERQYTQLGWSYDKQVRDTGPFINGTYYGTHPAVRIYYSPEVIAWLEAGRPADQPIPDGAMIIKEMFTPPAAIYEQFARDPKYQDPEKYEKLIAELVNSWTIMVKDQNGSRDGWFWGSVSLPNAGQSLEQAIESQVDSLENRGQEQLRWSGFSMPCIRCHASAASEMTFSDLTNIRGYPGNPLLFLVDDSWRTPSYIAQNYPLCRYKDDPYVEQFMYLPPDTTPMGDIACPPPAPKTPEASRFSDHLLSNNLLLDLPPKSALAPAPDFLRQFPQIPKQVKAQVQHFPPEWLDFVAMPKDHDQRYITSNNCVGCHGGLSGTPNRAVMFVQNGEHARDGFNVSEYGEWRWSPMGLAGRDPIFHAQLESEMAYLKRDEAIDQQHPRKPPLLKAPLKQTQRAVTNLCLSCHGAMGQRQLQADAEQDKSLDPNFNVDYFYVHEALTETQYTAQEKAGHEKYDQYGALAREGISCMVCHHINAPDPDKIKAWKPEHDWLTKHTDKPLAFNLFYHSTGQYNPGPADTLYGPFDVQKLPMENSLGLKPIKNEYTRNSQMCGNCHTINLPNIGKTDDTLPILTATAKGTAFEAYPHTIEQATFLEWQNSIFAATDRKGRPDKSFQSCIDCHMPGSFENAQAGIDIKQLVTQIASIEDSSYPAAAHTLANEDLDIPMRNDYSRHTHVGLNVFLLSMVDQFSDVLGLQKLDYMTGSANGVAMAIDGMVQQAQKATADIAVGQVQLKAIDEHTSLLEATVTVTNKTGHRYPSGVAFRRAFIEFTVSAAGETLWQSGGTNSVGVIVDGDGNPLKSEFLPNQNSYQPHYQVVDSQDKVQIYEELNLNAQNEFTTSFVHRVHDVKDNRLLPKGWRESQYFKSQGELMVQFMEATDPKGVDGDKDYRSRNNDKFAGQDRLLYRARIPAQIDPKSIRVTATLYNQSIPPYWLKQRFDAAPDGVATRRLHYLASHLKLDNTPMQDWKLKLVSDTREAVSQ